MVERGRERESSIGGGGVDRGSKGGSPKGGLPFVEWADMYAVGAPPTRRHLGIDVDQAEGRNFCAARGGGLRAPFLSNTCASPRISFPSLSPPLSLLPTTPPPARNELVLVLKNGERGGRGT